MDTELISVNRSGKDTSVNDCERQENENKLFHFHEMDHHNLNTRVFKLIFQTILCFQM